MDGGKDKGGKGKVPKGRSDLALNDGVVGLVESHGKDESCLTRASVSSGLLYFRSS
jgi:hypothetical protein